MKKENFEEGIKRIAIVIYLLYSFLWFFAHGLVGTTVLDWIKINILNLGLFKNFFYALHTLGDIVLWWIIIPFLIYFIVKFIWDGFFKK